MVGVDENLKLSFSPFPKQPLPLLLPGKYPVEHGQSNDYPDKP